MRHREQFITIHPRCPMAAAATPNATSSMFRQTAVSDLKPVGWGTVPRTCAGSHRTQFRPLETPAFSSQHSGGGRGIGFRQQRSRRGGDVVPFCRHPAGGRFHRFRKSGNVIEQPTKRSHPRAPRLRIER